MIASLFLGVVTIILPAESGMRGNEIDLTEVVTIQGADAATLKTLEGVELSGAPVPGYRRVFTRADIMTRIRRADPTIEVSFKGRGAVSVYPETMLIKGEQIVAKVEQKLLALKGQRDITWKLNKKIGAIEVPLGATSEPTVEVDLQVTSLVSGRLGVKVRLLSDGVVYRTVWADWEVSVWEQLPVLTQAVPAGGSVLPNMFALQRTELPSSGFASVLAPEAMVGAVAKRNLAMGSVVTEADVTRPMVIHTGDSVTLIVKKGPIRAAVSAIALETGGVGDLIRIKRLDSTTKVELKARVISSDTVEIDLNK